MIAAGGRGPGEGVGRGSAALSEGDISELLGRSSRSNTRNII
jgi:hypothetical protein